MTNESQKESDEDSGKHAAFRLRGPGGTTFSGNDEIAKSIAAKIGWVVIATAFAIACYGLSFIWNLLDG